MKPIGMMLPLEDLTMTRDYEAEAYDFLRMEKEGYSLEPCNGYAPGAPTYTRAEVLLNYDRHRQGLITGCEWRELERDMCRAPLEGRIWRTPEEEGDFVRKYVAFHSGGRAGS